MSDSTATASTPARVALKALPALLVNSAPVTLLVPDFADPCGIRKIARRVQAAYEHNTPDGRGGWTTDRWEIVFAGPYMYPAILVSYGPYEYETTDREPEDGGPCDGCRAMAARQA